jgi:Zn finger protein HypA/HybF involved in hydrogenase expression
MDLPFFRCASCGSGAVTVASGNEFEVESIEVEEVQCIGPR